MILDRIATDSGVSVGRLMTIIQTANHRYRTYTIPKRTDGVRPISHPTPELKYLQRWMNRNLFSYLEIHDSVKAYRKGISVADNARLHARQNYLLKIDFEDFFPSLTSADVRSIMNANLAVFEPSISAEDIEIVVQTVCKNGALTIGAPSSPALSNAILYDFDCFAFEACSNLNAVYSRYADDIFISTDEPDILTGLLVAIRNDLNERRSPALRINNHKTVFTSRKRRRVVTGLVLTSDCELSIGRKKKREIRSMIHRYGKDDLPAEAISYLRGYIAFVSSVEPEFIIRLRRRYGADLLESLIHEDLVSRKDN